MDWSTSHRVAISTLSPASSWNDLMWSRPLPRNPTIATRMRSLGLLLLAAIAGDAARNAAEDFRKSRRFESDISASYLQNSWQAEARPTIRLLLSTRRRGAPPSSAIP